MAEEKKQEEVQESAGGSKKKLIIIIAIVSILAIGLSVGVTLFLLTGSDDKPEEAASEVAAEVKLPLSYLDLSPPFLVTFNVEGRQRYMQISLSVANRDASVFTSIEHHMPLIRSRLIGIYGGMDFNVIKTEAGKTDLQAKTVAEINAVLAAEGEGQIENIYFTNFVLQ